MNIEIKYHSTPRITGTLNPISLEMKKKEGIACNINFLQNDIPCQLTAKATTRANVQAITCVGKIVTIFRFMKLKVDSACSENEIFLISAKSFPNVCFQTELAIKYPESIKKNETAKYPP
jgi:uncharacterized protein YqkB